MAAQANKNRRPSGMWIPIGQKGLKAIETAAFEEGLTEAEWARQAIARAMTLDKIKRKLDQESQKWKLRKMKKAMSKEESA